MFVRALAAGLVVLGCAAEPDKGGAWSPGKADGFFDLREVGPLELEQTTSIQLDGSVPAFRVESFGETQLIIELAGQRGADAYLVVEGPLDDADNVPPGTGAVFAEDDDDGGGSDALLSVNLYEPGVYRILTGTFPSMGLRGRPEGELEVIAHCRANCRRGMIDQKDLLSELRSRGQLDAMAEAARATITETFPADFAVTGLIRQFETIIASPTFDGIERFPTIPMNLIGAIGPTLGLISAEPSEPDRVIRGELKALLGNCTPERARPDPAHPDLPDLGYGHFPNYALSPCQAAHSEALAQILTSLAADNGTEITYRGEVHRTPADLVAALLATGHEVEIRNERTYANFISLTLGEKDAIWPVWLDTGIVLASGETLVVPMGHSHHAWRIEGPEVDARVMFFLGVGGAGFFAQTSTRPAWTGELVSSSQIARDGDDAYLRGTLDTAATYLRRIRYEATTVAAGLPADGYGYLGVCNDSNAVIEYQTAGTITTFPLLRNAELDRQPPYGDGLDEAIRALPKDGAGFEPMDGLRRILAMTPMDPTSPEPWDAELAAQLAEAMDDATLP